MAMFKALFCAKHSSYNFTELLRTIETMLLFTLLTTIYFRALSLAAPLSKRASLTQVSSFGSNPANIGMYMYVPDAVSNSPGIVVSLHGASGNAQQQFQSTPYARLAEQYGFIVIYPESPQGAWDATSAKSLLHDGGGASQSIANMARYVTATYKTDTSKVFVSGISSGGTMTVSYHKHPFILPTSILHT